MKRNQNPGNPNPGSIKRSMCPLTLMNSNSPEANLHPLTQSEISDNSLQNILISSKNASSSSSYRPRSTRSERKYMSKSGEGTLRSVESIRPLSPPVPTPPSQLWGSNYQWKGGEQRNSTLSASLSTRSIRDHLATRSNSRSVAKYLEIRGFKGQIDHLQDILLQNIHRYSSDDIVNEAKCDLYSDVEKQLGEQLNGYQCKKREYLGGQRDILSSLKGLERRLEGYMEENVNVDIEVIKELQSELSDLSKKSRGEGSKVPISALNLEVVKKEDFRECKTSNNMLKREVFVLNEKVRKLEEGGGDNLDNVGNGGGVDNVDIGEDSYGRAEGNMRIEVDTLKRENLELKERIEEKDPKERKDQTWNARGTMSSLWTQNLNKSQLRTNQLQGEQQSKSRISHIIHNIHLLMDTLSNSQSNSFNLSKSKFNFLTTNPFPIVKYLSDTVNSARETKPLEDLLTELEKEFFTLITKYEQNDKWKSENYNKMVEQMKITYMKESIRVKQNCDSKLECLGESKTRTEKYVENGVLQGKLKEQELKTIALEKKHVEEKYEELLKDHLNLKARTEQDLLKYQGLVRYKYI